MRDVATTDEASTRNVMDMSQLGRTVIAFIAFAVFSCSTSVSVSWGVDEELPVAVEDLKVVIGDRMVSNERASLRGAGAKWAEVFVEVRSVDAKRVTVVALSEGPGFVAQDAIFRIADMLLTEGLISPDQFAALSAVQGLRTMEQGNGLIGNAAVQFDELRARRATAAPPPYRTSVDYVD